MLGLASAVGMVTVAEGVESADQLRHLHELGCPLVQGYHLGRPVPGRQAELVLEESLKASGPLGAREPSRAVGALVRESH